MLTCILHLGARALYAWKLACAAGCMHAQYNVMHVNIMNLCVCILNPQAWGKEAILGNAQSRLSISLNIDTHRVNA